MAASFDPEGSGPVPAHESRFPLTEVVCMRAAQVLAYGKPVSVTEFERLVRQEFTTAGSADKILQ